MQGDVIEVLFAPPVIGTSGTNQFTLNAADKYIAWVVQVPASLSSYAVRKIGFRRNGSSGSVPSFVAALRSVDASTGLITGADLRLTSAFTPSSGVWRWETLTSDYTVTPGQLLAAQVRHSSGTIDGSNNATFGERIGTTAMGFPFAIEFDGTTSTKIGGPPSVGFEMADGSRWGWTVTGTFSRGFRNTSGDFIEYGNRFQLSATSVPKFQVVGMIPTFTGALPSGVSTTVRLYNSSGTLLQDVSRHNGVNRDGALPLFLFDENPLPTLNGGDLYRIVIHNPSTSTNLSVRYHEQTDTGNYATYPFGAQSYVTRKSFGSSSFSDVPGELVDMRLLIRPVSSGGRRAASNLT